MKPLTKCQPHLWRELDGTPSIVVIDTEDGNYYRASEADARLAELRAQLAIAEGQRDGERALKSLLELEIVACNAAIEQAEAERDAARAALAHVASIAHQGGLAGYDYHEALADIRALTIKNWNGEGTRADALERLNAAIDAARRE